MGGEGDYSKTSLTRTTVSQILPAAAERCSETTKDGVSESGQEVKEGGRETRVVVVRGKGGGERENGRPKLGDGVKRWETPYYWKKHDTNKTPDSTTGRIKPTSVEN